MRPLISITPQMIASAIRRAPEVAVKRTKTSNYDTVYGLLGEYCFAQWLFNDWEGHSKIDTKGQIDFLNRIEVKTSAFPFSDKLNLLVREDYAKKRKPDFYVQTIIDLPSRANQKIHPNTICVLAGYATNIDVEDAPLKDFGSKFGGPGGYRCKYIRIDHLKPVEELKSIFKLN